MSRVPSGDRASWHRQIGGLLGLGLPGLGLLGLAALSLAGYVFLAGARGWSQPADVGTFLITMGGLFACYAAALLICRAGGWRGRRQLLVMLVSAACFRLALVPAGAQEGWSGAVADVTAGPARASAYDSFLLYDNDVWRYLWDGRVLLAGVDTYRLSPAEIEDLADDGDERFGWLEQEAWAALHPRIGYNTYRTIYPPLAQVFFVVATAVAPASVAAWKLLLILFDLASCLLLADLAGRAGRPTAVAVYAWNPLVIKELAGSAHVDALLIFFLLLAFWCLERGRQRAALAALGGAILIKLTPILVVPLFLKRTRWQSWWLLPAVGAVAYGPLLGSLAVMTASLQAFARDWAFNAGPWAVFLQLGRLLGAEGRGLADGLSLLTTLGVVAVVSWRDSGPVLRAASGVGWILGVYVLLSPTVMPWYLLWALPFLALRPSPLWPLVTAASLLSYGIYLDGVERTAWLAVEYGLIAAAGIRTCGRARP